ncbi:MAG: hypothetical protein ACR2IM_03240, partial [Sediminibacterium sp.]
RIDETGLTQLVQKFKRDKIVKEEKKMSYDEAAILMPSFPSASQDSDETDLVIDRDLAHEKNLVRVMIEFGNEILADGRKISDWVWEELESFPLENPDMIQLMQAYKNWQEEGKMPNGKTLQYHENENVQKWVLQLFTPEQELSQRWNEKLGLKKKEGEERNFLAEVEISLMYFKLRKVKKMILQNQNDLENAATSDEIHLLQIHKHLKQVERELTQHIGTVIFK